jgi:3,4-dihydroxy 2-butanone 4-phosphate synthase
VKIPTGGIPVLNRRARERFRCKRKVSRFGEIPKPTVIVRIKEDKEALQHSCALIHIVIFQIPVAVNQILIHKFGDRFDRVELALSSLRAGKGVLVADSPDRENEADLIFPSQFVTVPQMAQMIRECSGIVCLCMTDEKIRSLELPMMVSNNTSGFQTAFTVSIEAAEGVTTGVSAADRVQTVRVASADHARPSDLRQPGHIFPLRARSGGVLERSGHTEGTVDLMRLAGLKPSGVLCELTNPDGTMANMAQTLAFAEKHGYPVLTIEDIVAWRKRSELKGWVA